MFIIDVADVFVFSHSLVYNIRMVTMVTILEQIHQFMQISMTHKKQT